MQSPTWWAAFQAVPVGSITNRLAFFCPYATYMAKRRAHIRLTVTRGNITNGHIYITAALNVPGFFPDDAFGSPSGGQPGKAITLQVEGLAEPVETDIPTEADGRTPRKFFRRRDWIRSFLILNNMKPGDHILLEKVGDRAYRLRPEISGELL